MSLTHAEHVRRDSPLKCSGCDRWMRSRPTPSATRTYAQRRAVAHADRCVDCLPHYPCHARCEQCRFMVKDGSTGRWSEIPAIEQEAHKALGAPNET